MSRLQQALARAATDLSDHGAAWALVGGLAVSARLEPRFTRDLDLALAVPDDAAAETLVAFLSRRGYRAIATVEQLQVERLATVRLIPPGEREPGLVVDLLFASSGIEAEVVAEAEAFEVLPGLVARVARLHHLLALKVLSRDDRRRPQDRVDLAALLAAASPEDIERARQALGRIAERGFHRGKDLIAELESALGDLGGP